METLNAKLSGSKINQYQIVKQIGQGSYATVHLATDTLLNTNVAIKQFSKGKLRRQRAIFRKGNSIDLIRSEVAILKKLDHCNIVKLFEVLDDPTQDSLFMVFELCDKSVMSIDANSSTTPLEISLARNYFTQLVYGLEYMHYNGIAHRDIKPDNLLLLGGVLKIVDFGVSEMMENHKNATKLAGSPAFYPPEICILNHGLINIMAADIWAAGATLFCFIYGHTPFSGITLVELCNNIQTKAPSFPAKAEPLSLDLLKRMLEKVPENRISISDIRLHPWVTSNGSVQLISKDENCKLVERVTQNDVQNAIKPIKSSLFTVMKAASKFRSKTTKSFLSKIK